MAQFRHQTPEPTVIARRFQTYAHRLVNQAAIELACFLGVVQTPLPVLSALLVYVRYLLETRMKITSYNHHLGSFPSEPPGRCATTNLLGRRGADAVM